MTATSHQTLFITFQVRTPLILLGMKMDVEASNWSTALRASGNFALQMSYYNESISVWEPVRLLSSLP